MITLSQLETALRRVKEAEALADSRNRELAAKVMECAALRRELELLAAAPPERAEEASPPAPSDASVEDAARLRHAAGCAPHESTDYAVEKIAGMQLQKLALWALRPSAEHAARYFARLVEGGAADIDRARDAIVLIEDGLKKATVAFEKPDQQLAKMERDSEELARVVKYLDRDGPDDRKGTPSHRVYSLCAGWMQRGESSKWALETLHRVVAIVREHPAEAATRIADLLGPDWMKSRADDDSKTSETTATSAAPESAVDEQGKVEDEGAGAAERSTPGPFVATRRDGRGRWWWAGQLDGWNGAIKHAKEWTTLEDAEREKPRRSKVVAVSGIPALLESDKLPRSSGTRAGNSVGRIIDEELAAGENLEDAKFDAAREEAL